MDDTQRLQSDDDDGEETPVDRLRPVGNLHMFAGIHGPAQDFPIYRGQNLIGRHASCDITLPAQSVSKKHAILEVKADSHTICDNTSLNKTRRTKAALTPNVRYALTDGDFLMFADVACRYTIQKKMEEASILEESEDDSVLVPGTQGALAIEKTPGVAIRRMVRGAVLARDSGDEDEGAAGQKKTSEGGEGIGSLRGGHKTTGHGTMFSPITDTIVPESDEENDTSTSESRFPSLNLRCDSDTDTHDTPARLSSFTPSSLNISTPSSLKEQTKDESRNLPPVDKEEKKIDIRTDGDLKLTLLTGDASDAKDDQAVEPKAEAVPDSSFSDGDGHVQKIVVSDTSDIKLKDVSTLNTDKHVEHEREETLKDSTINKQTNNPCAKEEDAGKSDTEQKVSDETSPDVNVTIEVNNVELVDTGLRMKEVDFCLDSETDVDEEDTTTCRSGVMKAETLETITDGGQEQNNGRTVGMAGTVFNTDGENDAATSEADLETGKPHHINSDTDDEADEQQKKNGSLVVNPDSDTDVEDKLKVLQSKSESAELNTRKVEGNRTSGTTETSRTKVSSDSDVETIVDMPKPDGKSHEQDSRNNDEEKEGFHLDSDTDVEDDVDVSNTEVKKDERTTTITVKETNKGIHLDSDIDVDEDTDHSMKTLTKGEQDSRKTRMDAQEPKDAFSLDSDTDVDEDDLMPGASNAAVENKPTSQDQIDDQQSVRTAKSYSEKEEIGVTNEEASALHTDDDTDVDEEDVGPVLEEARPAEQTAISDCKKTEMDVTSEGAAALHMDSDTDVEDNDGPHVPELDKTQAGDHSGSVCEEPAARPEASKVEAPSVSADDSVEEDETQKTDSENTNFESMATQCYLEPQEQESDLPDEEEATQAYVFSSTWAEPDPFKRPADPIGVLQISAVTVDTSEEEIDENAIAETQPYCSNAETPELGNDSVIDQEATQPADNVAESGKEGQQLTCGPVSQEDTQPVSQYLSIRAPEETGSWLQLKRDVPASVWARAIQHEGASTDLKEDLDKEDDAEKEDEQVSSIELEVTQPYTLGIPSLQQHPAHVHSPDMPAAEEDNMEAGISAVPPTDNSTSQPCNVEAQTTDDQATQAHSQSAPDSNGTQICIPLVQKSGDDDTQPSNLNVVATESDNTPPCSSLSVSAKEEQAKETSNKDQVKLYSKRGLSRSRKRAESEKNAETAAEVIEHPEDVPVVPDSLPETLSDLNAEELKQPGTETTEELTAEKGGRRRGARKMGVVDVEDKIKTKEEAVSTVTRKRTNRMVCDVEPSTSGINEKVKRKQPTGKSLAKVAKKELEDDHEEESGPCSLESRDISSSGNLPINPVEIIKSQTPEDDKKDNVVKHMPEKTEDHPNENDKDPIPTFAEQKGNGGKSSAGIIESKELMVSDRSCTQVVFESSSDLPNKKCVTTKTRAATKLKKSNTVEAESRDNGGKVEDENVDDQKFEVCLEEDEVHRPVSRTIETQKVEEGLGKRKTRKSGAASAETVEQKKKKGEVATASKKGQNEEVQVSPAGPSSGNEKPGRLRRNLAKDIKEESENVTSKRSMSLRGGEKTVEEKELHGNSEDSPVSNKMTRRTRHTKVEEEKPEEVTDVGKTEAGDAARKPRKTRKNWKDEQITENDIGNKEEPTVSETQTRRSKRECREQESVAKSENVKETVSRRAKKNSAEEDVARLEEEQSNKSGRTRKGSKEELKTEQKEDVILTETQKADPVGQKTTLRIRKNAKDGKKTGNEQQAEVNTTPEKLSSKSRRKTSTEEPKEAERDRKEEAVERAGLQPEAELSVHEEKSRLNAGRSRRTAIKEDVPQVSTPVAARKRGQPSKAEVEVKRKKSDEPVEQKPVAEGETTPRRGRPRKLAAEASNTQTVNADAKEISPPDPSPSRSSRQRPSSALSNPPEVLFTGVVDAVGEGIIRSLGGDIADSVFDCTHLVTDRVRRTVKFLCALARGIPIVTLDWIDKCKKSGCFLSPTGFLVNDKEQEKIFNFVLAKSLQKAKRKPLLEGYEIHITSNVKPEPEHMKDIIRCSGATFLPKMPRTFKEKCIIVSCPEDAARCKSAPSSVPVTTAEFILSGILRQEVNPSAYLLNPATESPGPAPAKRRR
ncbi:mediator of DNA damage checkpoint protein 1 isoform X2 [Pseudophryne corroboree]|uniref:mediator of DNA damage checkpoint protein 1 isoform X2 n=1 Tax=Pseudophryne corroboree TaxID=495146 RepID=UPI003081A778